MERRRLEDVEVFYLSPHVLSQSSWKDTHGQKRPEILPVVLKVGHLSWCDKESVTLGSNHKISLKVEVIFYPRTSVESQGFGSIGRSVEKQVSGNTHGRKVSAEMN